MTFSPYEGVTKSSNDDSDIHHSRHRVEEREYQPFEHIRDSPPTLTIMLDELLQHRDGVHHLSMLDFMDARGSLGEEQGRQATEWSATG